LRRLARRAAAAAAARRRGKQLAHRSLTPADSADGAPARSPVVRAGADESVDAQHAS
jgi:hypothetical protein